MRLNPDRSYTGRFRELDVLRGLAALTVVFFHYSRHGTRYFVAYPFDFWEGEFGVHLFFTISGFVIYFTLERSRTLGDFLFSRFSRLYPTYWTVLGLLLIWACADPAQHLWLTGYVVNLSMLQRFVGFPDVDNVYWTLGVELVFYAVMAVVFGFRQLHRIVSVCLVWLAAGVVWGSVHHFTESGEQSVGNIYFILPYAPYFVAGIMFYMLYSRGMRLVYTAVIVLACGVIWVVQGAFVAGITVFIFAVFALALSGALRFLINPVTLWLGGISYPLYLVHRLPGYALLDWMNAHHISHWCGFAIALGGSLAAAQLLSTLVERPALRKLRAWYHGRDRRQSVTPIP